MPSISEWRHAVLVVELGLGDRVVDVDRREQQCAAALELIKPVHAGGGLLGDALDVLAPCAVKRVGSLGDGAAQRLEDDAVLLGVVLVRLRYGAGGLELDAHVDQQGGVAAVVDDRVGALAVRPGQHLLGAPPVLLQRLALPGEDGNALRVLGSAVRADDDRRGGVVLGGEDVAADPAHVGAERGQRLDEHGRLDGHVQASRRCACRRAAAPCRTPRAAPSGRASRARRARSPCGRTRRGRGRRP